MTEKTFEELMGYTLEYAIAMERFGFPEHVHGEDMKLVRWLYTVHQLRLRGWNDDDLTHVKMQTTDYALSYEKERIKTDNDFKIRLTLAKLLGGEG